MNVKLAFTFCFLLALLGTQARVQTTDCSIFGDSSVCENEAQSYISGYTGGYQYSWGVFGGTVVGSNTAPSVNINWGFVGSGQVTVVIKDSSNTVLCTKIMNVVIHPLPTPEIIPGVAPVCNTDSSRQSAGEKREDQCISACDSTWLTYTTDFNAGSTYSWTVTGTPTYTTSGNTITVYWENIGLGLLEVTETTAAGCVAKHSICINVIPRPSAIFSTITNAVAGVVDICLGQSVFFENASLTNGGSDLFTYEWIFGDGEGDVLYAPTSGNISHPYIIAGTHTAMLIITNDCGCRDTASVTVNVSSTPGPDIQCVSTVCPGSPISYSTSATCTTYNWSVTNGAILSGAGTDEVTVQWSGVSPAVLTLATPGCSGFCSTPTSLVIPVIPTSPTYSADTIMCQYACQELVLDCAIPIDSIIWHLPAGLFITTPDTLNRHKIEICSNGTLGSGTIWVEYFHTTNGSTVDLECGGDLYIPIHVRPSFFLGGGNTFCENANFTFGSYTPTFTNVFWEIRDISGALMTSTTVLSTAPFTGVWSYGPGLFTVYKTDADDQHCNKTEILQVTVNENPLPPSIAGADTVCPNSSHMYTGIVVDALHTINWSVINGTPATGSGLTTNVTWGATGPYIINASSLDIQTGCKSTVVSDTIGSYLPITASIINGPDTICSNGFANYSTPAYGTNYEWSINSSLAGSVKTGQYSNTIEVQTNNYTGNAWVVLERTLCNLVRRDSVLVYVRPAPNPLITAPDTVCVNALYTVSTATVASTYAWDFGDGTLVSGTSTTNTYDAPGAYVVTLTINYGGACPVSVSTTKNVVVIPAPEINISTADPTVYCNGTPPPSISTTMYAAASIGTTGVTWYKSPSTAVGTGISYTAITVGSYYAIAVNAEGCTSTSDPIIISLITCGPGCRPENHTLGFSIDRLGCNTDSFHYTASNVFDIGWDFNDIHNPSFASGNDVTHTYTEPGVYRTELCGKVPEAVATSTDSCIVCVERFDTINYVPDFYPIINCVDYSDSYTVTFDNTTKVFALAPLPSFSWHINGGASVSTSTDYTTSLAPGTYSITLKISGVCEYTESVTIVAPTLALLSAADSVCVGVPVSFTNASSPILGLDWSFGDGSTSLLDNPVRAYDAAGNYNVILTILNQYGCRDSAHQEITVLPNTLAGILTLSGPNEFCFGDSVDITATVSGGYSPYDYLWTTIETTSTIRARQTGNYGVDLYDSKGCFLKIADTTILVNPIPNPTILGENEYCQNALDITYVASQAIGHTFMWTYDGLGPYGGGNAYYPSSVIGTHQIIVTVTNSFGCDATDTFNYVTNGLPNVAIATTGSLCAGDNNILVASSSSPILDYFFWNTGLVNDSLQTKIANIYTATAVDSNGCENTAKVVVHRLPDLCGLMTGCYEICDTVTSLQWFAPVGYASYKWYYNGTAIAGAFTSVLDVPLHQSGTYTVIIANSVGCEIESDPIDIEFTDCTNDCNINACAQLECGRVDADGNQQYNVTFLLTNNVSPGASITIASAQGSVTSISPPTLAMGINTVNAVFTDLPSIDATACFYIKIFDQEEECDTSVCVDLPDCPQKECEVTLKPQQVFTCAGYDDSGNPMYYGCMDIIWSGSNGSEVTLLAPNSSFSPSPILVNNGINTVCFTYTDLPSYDPGGLSIQAYIFDPVTKETCKKESSIETDQCGEICELKIEKLRAKCNKQTADGYWNYVLDFDVLNSTGAAANVQILAIAEGTFSSITPNPVPIGWNSMTAIFTDNAISDAGSNVCFRILITNPANGSKCYTDVCIELPDCDKLKVNEQFPRGISIYPNPMQDIVSISFKEQHTNAMVSIITLNGKEVITQYISSSEPEVSIDVSNLESSLYFIEITTDEKGTLRQKIIKE